MTDEREPFPTFEEIMERGEELRRRLTPDDFEKGLRRDDEGPTEARVSDRLATIFDEEVAP